MAKVMLPAFARARWIARAFQIALPWFLVASAGHVYARTYTIMIEGVQFLPATLHVAPGDVIVWKNKDPFPHMITALDRQFDSGEMRPGGQWHWVAKQLGEFQYFCALHTTMRASVIVDKAASRKTR